MCPKEYRDMFKDYLFPKSENVWDTLQDKPELHRVWAGDGLNRDKDELRIDRAAFFACNSFVDYEIGRLLDSIDELAPDSLVIYTSDHGDMLQSHCISGKGPAMYDEITNIPLLIRWPGVIPAATINTNPTSHIDVAPTIMDAMGLSVPKTLDGRSIVPELQDPTKATNDAIFMEFGKFGSRSDGYGGFAPIRSCFDGRHKLTINLLDSDELYDLEEDPGEITNLIRSEEHAAIRDQLHDRLLGWMNETVDPFRGHHWSKRPWRTNVPEWTWGDIARHRHREEDEPPILYYSSGLELYLQDQDCSRIKFVLPPER